MAIILIPIGALANAFFSTGNQVHINKKNFKTLSIAKVGQTGSMVSVQSALPFLGFSYTGLIIGHITGRILSVLILFRNQGEIIYGKLTSRWKAIFKKYADHPMYVLSSSLLSTFSKELPVLAIAPIFGSVLLGFYGLAFRVLMMPITLIIVSTGYVFFQNFSEKFNKRIPLSSKI
ncbi:oligosaccharide flippase family protein [Gracilimonas sp.]|uniref:oligosaccharide flippase family protein n=1 Tax=Gracilimonas sp. TaxID=1974203 RepID=UPI0028715DE1|nr:oligosaccharide flippase family protein [Gracilimonas sp.]